MYVHVDVHVGACMCMEGNNQAGIHLTLILSSGQHALLQADNPHLPT